MPRLLISTRRHFVRRLRRRQKVLGFRSKLPVPFHRRRRTGTFFTWVVVVCRFRANIVHVLGSFTSNASGLSGFSELDKVYTDPNTAFIVLPFFSGGDLEQMLEGPKMPEHKVLRIMTQMLDGVVKLQKHGKAHRDLKADNIFFVGGKQELALADFGEVGPLQLEYEYGVSPGGATGYLAPEIRTQTADGAACTIDYSKNDIYAVGIMSYQLCMGSKEAWPWPADIPPQMLKIDHLHRIPDDRASAELREFVEEGLLHPDPAKRMTAEEAQSRSTELAFAGGSPQVIAAPAPVLLAAPADMDPEPEPEPEPQPVLVPQAAMPPNALQIRQQIESLFDDEHLPQDRWLRKQLSKDGMYWCNLSIIVGFNRIKALGQPTVAAVATALRGSDLLEVSEDGLRVRRTRPLPQPQSPVPPQRGASARWEWYGDGKVCEFSLFVHRCSGLLGHCVLDVAAASQEFGSLIRLLQGNPILQRSVSRSSRLIKLGLRRWTWTTPALGTSARRT